MNNIDDNIIFFLEEKTEERDNLCEIEKMLNELEDGEDSEELNIEINNEEFYEDYTIKHLLRICEYYGIEKNVKMAKYKKQDIISSIVYFESLPKNARIVNNRHRMWSYIIELMNDAKMKKYVIWN